MLQFTRKTSKEIDGYMWLLYLGTTEVETHNVEICCKKCSPHPFGSSIAKLPRYGRASSHHEAPETVSEIRHPVQKVMGGLSSFSSLMLRAIFRPGSSGAMPNRRSIPVTMSRLGWDNFEKCRAGIDCSILYLWPPKPWDVPWRRSWIEMIETVCLHIEIYWGSLSTILYLLSMAQLQ